MKIAPDDLGAKSFPKVNAHEPDALAAALAAADQWVDDRTTWAKTDDAGQPVPPPEPLVQAVRLMTARYLARRNSPEGLVGMAELGIARLATVDADVRTLIAPYRRAVLA